MNSTAIIDSGEQFGATPPSVSQTQKKVKRVTSSSSAKHSSSSILFVDNPMLAVHSSSLPSQTFGNSNGKTVDSNQGQQAKPIG